MKAIKLSVVIPLYNKESTIIRAVNSVLSQSYEDFGLIVVDDGSTDSGPELVASIQDERIELVRQENAGVSAARNKGIESAAGGLIAFLDADDYWSPELLEEMLRLRAIYPEAALYAVGYRQVAHDGKSRIIHAYTGGNHQDALIYDYIDRTRGGNFVHSSSVMIPFERLEEIGGFPLGERFGEDLLVWAKIGIRYPIAVSSKILGNFFLDTANTAPRHSYVPDRHPLLSYLVFECENLDRPLELRNQAKRALVAKIFQVSHYIARSGNIDKLKVFLNRKELIKYTFRLRAIVNMPCGLTIILLIHKYRRAKLKLLLVCSKYGYIIQNGVVQGKDSHS